MNKLLIFLTVVIGISFLSFKTIGYIENQARVVPVYGEPGHLIPDFEFTNQLGQIVNDKDLEGKIWVVDFFFTSCPTICPKMTRNLQTLHDYIRQEDDIQILSFTVDPKRDQPARLKTYAEKYNADHDSWYFLTGKKEDLYRLGNRGFLLSASEVGDDTDFIHSENWVLVDQKRQIRGFYRGTDSKAVNQILRDIRKLKKSKA